MTFLNPSILFGLLAISIPILIHLLNLRKIRKVEFSTLMFLKEIQKSKMRRIRLKQILLLLLRIFTVVFLVLSFANPVYEGYAGNIDDDENSTVLIFLDDSFSMAARDNKGQYFSQAKEAVKKILESHSESDNIYFIPVSKIEFKNNKFFFDGIQEIKDSLERVQLSYKPAGMNEILTYADQILRDSKSPNKEIYIISDFQKINLNEENTDGRGFEGLKKNPVSTFLIKEGNREVNNLSLDSFTVSSKIIERDKDIKIKIYLTNHTQFKVTNKTVNLYVDNELRGEKAVDINPFDKTEVEFLFKSGHHGNVNGVIELIQTEFQEDEILQDNKYYFSLYIPDRFNIGLIESSGKDFYFINLALQTASNILSDSIKRQSELFNISSESNVNENIYRYNVVFISNKNSFTDTEAGILKDYISNGGGVFLFPGNNIDVNNYNNILLSKLGSFRIASLNTNIESNQNLKFDKVDFENPVLSEIFSSHKLSSTSDQYNIESPKINSYFELLPEESSNSIITLINNRPFLLESKLAKGKIIISSVSATDDMSDLPFKSIFVPLIIRSVYYLSNNFEFQKEYIAGRSNLISLRAVNNINDIILPDKSVINPGIDLKSSAENYLFLPYEEFTSEVGIYAIKDTTGLEFNFALNKNSAESSTLFSTEEEVTEYFNKNGIENVTFISKNEDISGAVRDSKTGFSLWKYFLIGAILFALAEMLLSKKIEEG